MNYSRKFLKLLTGSLPLLLAGELLAAPAFDPSAQPLGSIAPLTLSDTDLAGGATAYRGWFENGAWQGDVIEYTVSSSGALTTSVDLTDTSPSNPGSPPDNWSAHVAFATAEAASATYWDSRVIITNSGSTQLPFRWDSLSAAQKILVDNDSRDAGSSDLFDFIRGDRDNEGSAYRHRYTVLGDIIHSNPVYVGPPKGAVGSGGYAAWAAESAQVNRDERVYVGANDGMLHAFDGDDGTEAWAYVPSSVIGGLDALSGRPYSHLYSVDGQLTVQDVYYSSSWHTVLVGGLGAGGKAWFGLDITTPTLSSETSEDAADQKVLWELTATGDDDLGQSYGQATITKLNDENWYAIFGNGYNSVNGIAKLYIVSISDGTVVKRISTLSGSSGAPNGLSAPSLVDTNRDGMADIAYAGDIDGNLWKFDLNGDTVDSWALAYSPNPLHEGAATQAIIQPPEVTLHPSYGHLVYVGTGRLFTEPEMDDLTVQSVYGIWDKGTTPPTAETEDLLAQTLSGDNDYTAEDIAHTVQTFNPSPTDPIDWTSQHGWKIDLPAGYRVLSPPQLRGGRVKVTIHKPDERSNYILESYYLDGGSPGSPIFDLNQSGSLTSADNFNANANEATDDPEDVVVMWKQPDGVMSQTAIARVSNGVDAQLLNYVVPPAAPPCSGDCVAGFQGGHIDVDTDYWDDKEGGVGDKTQKHNHEYDKKTGQVYVDYFDMNTGDATGHVELDDTDTVPSDTEWIVLVANADLSPGSVMTIGDKEWNVVEYQAMMHRALRDWNGTDALLDEDDESLIFTTGDISSDGGTVRHAFNDMAILAGGLHPNNTGCVKDGDSMMNGRYRGGAPGNPGG